MMVTTHVFTGVAMAAGLVAIVPRFAPVIAGAAIVGGLFPDLDLLGDHRKTLHYPVYYSAATVVAGLVALLFPAPLSVGIAVFFLTAAVHSVMDIFGAGLALRPWLGNSKRAVYDHYSGVWVPPRHWIRYDGAPEDFLLGAALAVPGIYAFDGIVHTIIIGALGISLVYTISRKFIARTTERILEQAPDGLVEKLPDHFLPDEESAETTTSQ